MRYERKWILNLKNYSTLIKQIVNFQLGFKKIYNDRYVNSLYFDFPILPSVKENYYGLTEKRKYRVRWYGNKNIIKEPILEIKKKNGWENEKELINLDNFNECKISQIENIKKLQYEINKKLNFKNEIIPLVSTHYLRKYFVSNKKSIRVTIDRFIETGEVLNHRFIRRHIDLKNMIFEMKYDERYDDFVKNKLVHKYRISKNSKFINALQYSSFKNKL